jgi:hypothetical protein
MNPLIQQLLDLLNALRPVSGASPNAFRDVFRAVAANAILQDPAQATIPPGPIDPQIVDAIHEGATRAAALKAAGRTLRLAWADVPIGVMSHNRLLAARAPPGQRTHGREQAGSHQLRSTPYACMTSFRLTPRNSTS